MKITLPEFLEILKNQLPKDKMPEILYDSPETNDKYNKERQIFNTYYRFRAVAMALSSRKTII